MTGTARWPTATPIRTARLDLEPLRVEHADEAAPLFDDERLHAFTGGTPAGADDLRARYARQAVGRSPDGAQAWLNWMARDHGTGRLVGTVQATVDRGGDGGLRGELAWVVGTDHQGRGYAREAAGAVAGWLGERDVRELLAHVHPDHGASAAVARAVGMAATDVVVDGEVRWSTRV